MYILKWGGIKLGEQAKLSFLGDGKFLTLLSSNFAAVWDITSQKMRYYQLFQPGQHGLSIFEIENGNMALCSGALQDVHSEDDSEYLLRNNTLDTGRCLFSTSYRTTRLPPIVSADGSLVAVSADINGDGIQIYQLIEGQMFLAFPLLPGLSPVVMFSGLGHFLAHWIEGATETLGIRLLDVFNGLHLDSLYATSGASVTFSTDGEIVAICENRPNECDITSFISTRNSKVIGTTNGHPMLLNTTHAFSPNGRWFASVVTDNSADLMLVPVHSGTIVLTKII